MNFSGKNVLFILLLASAGQLSAQSYKEELNKIRSCYYQKDKQVYYEVKIRYYSLDDLHHPLDSMSGKYYLYGSKMNISLGAVRTILDENNYLTIVDDEKKMVIGKNNHGEAAGSGLEMLDSLILDSVLFIKPIRSLKSGIKGYRFIYDNLLMDSLDVTFNEKTFFLNTLKIYYQSGESFGQDENYRPVISMEFNNQKISEQADLSMYRIDKYVSIIDKKKVVAAVKYKNYEIINNLNF